MIDQKVTTTGILAGLLLIGGCFRPFFLTPSPVLNVYYPNPIFVAAKDPQVLWETLVDVVDDYFEIEREEPIRQFDTVLTSGRIDTLPKIGATILEPWHKDSVDRYARWEATLQSIRRRAEIRVDPRDGGYWITVLVFKELEDVGQPLAATTSSATFRNDSSLTRVVSPIGEQQTHAGWIPMGRDTALEQRIIEAIGTRFGLLPVPTASTPPMESINVPGAGGNGTQQNPLPPLETISTRGS
ncbi:hypothetical protein THTE_1273 [Thermogutta terrifontis]|uniref:Lipoprotein n=1 Tax=Thermogutta terrifontis TaxID=1331910 RepID=A0A286RD31_9BACT|nr:hypothetical protein [Thermogutta terrifontis]ASV73875.1 hypothetical protein THTE_1273 [Thermogutta terrifontis]